MIQSAALWFQKIPLTPLPSRLFHCFTNEAELPVANLARPVRGPQEVAVGPRQFPVAERVRNLLACSPERRPVPGTLVRRQAPETNRRRGAVLPLFQPLGDDRAYIMVGA